MVSLLRRSVPVFQWALAVVFLAAVVVVGTSVVRELRAGTGGAAGSATAAVESPPPTTVPAGAISLPVLLFDDEKVIRVGDTATHIAALLGRSAEVGRYEDALEALTQAPPVLETELANSAGEIYFALGRIDEARVQFNRAVQGRAVDQHSARLKLAVIEWTYGDREAALATFDSFIDIYNGSTPLSSSDLTAVATAVRYLGSREHALFQDALRAYDEAIVADPGNLEPRILIGEFFLEKYQGTEADAAMQEVLQLNPNHPRALLGLARAMLFNNSVGVAEQVDKALEQNENLVEARVFKARLLIKVEDHEEARSELQKALDVNPTSLEL